MKNLKLFIGLMLLALVATACSKKKGGGGAPAPQQQNYHLEGGVCYDKNGDRVAYSYCDNDNGSYNGNTCVGYLYYTDCNTGKAYEYDCTRGNELDAVCEDPEAYKYPNEIVDCTNQAYDYNRYCRGNTRY